MIIDVSKRLSARALGTALAVVAITAFLPLLAALAAACGGAAAAPAVAEDVDEPPAVASPAIKERGPAVGTFAGTASMAMNRQEHAAALLADGRVLVAGGRGLGGGRQLKPDDSAELYDPATGTWSSAEPMAQARTFHTMTRLQDGRALVVGNKGKDASPEIYDPSTGAWSSAGETEVTRGEHTATLLQDGRVLITGGRGTRLQHLATSELYDPAGDTWSSGADLTEDRANHTATLLKDGTVLVVGSDVTLGGLPSAEVYDPANDTWSPTGALGDGRMFHTATLLQDGRVLVVGGREQTSAEIYEPSKGTWSRAGNMAQPRAEHAAVLLEDGRVLVIGGWPLGKEKTVVWESAELYDPAISKWSTAGAMSQVRHRFTATLLEDGRVLVAGGQGRTLTGGFYVDVEVWESVELYSP